MGSVVHHVSLDSFLKYHGVASSNSPKFWPSPSARKRPPAAMETQHRVLPGPSGRNRQRSSSFSGLSQSFSRFMPSNRPEKGGTARPMDNESKTGDSPSPPKSLIQIFSMRGQANGREDDGEEMRRTKSWSPKKIARITNERGIEGHRPSVEEAKHSKNAMGVAQNRKS